MPNSVALLPLGTVINRVPPLPFPAWGGSKDSKGVPASRRLAHSQWTSQLHTFHAGCFEPTVDSTCLLLRLVPFYITPTESFQISWALTRRVRLAGRPASIGFFLTIDVRGGGGTSFRFFPWMGGISTAG